MSPADRIVHELNNQLMIILGNTEVVLDELPAGNQRLRTLTLEISEAACQSSELARQLRRSVRDQEGAASSLEITGGGAPAERGAILVIDDEPQIRALTCTMLRLAGFQVLESGNGRDALALAEAQAKPIALVITDVMLPEKNGVDSGADILRAYPGCKIIYISGYSVEALIRRGLLSEGAELLQKPFSKASLINKVRELLQSRETQSSQPQRVEALR